MLPRQHTVLGDGGRPPEHLNLTKRDGSFLASSRLSQGHKLDGIP